MQALDRNPEGPSVARRAGATALPGRLARPVGDDEHAVGSPLAPVTLVAYGDYLCPRTRESWPVVSELSGELGDGLRLVWRHFPCSGNPGSRRAAEAAEVAAARGRFWEMHAALFEAARVIEGAHLTGYAAIRAGLNLRDFERDVARRLGADRVLDDLEGGLRSGVRETPAFFVDGVRQDGHSYLLDVLLKATQEGKPARGDRGVRGRQVRGGGPLVARRGDDDVPRGRGRKGAAL